MEATLAIDGHRPSPSTALAPPRGWRAAERPSRASRFRPRTLLDTPRAQRWLAIVVPWSGGDSGGRSLVAGVLVIEDEARTLQDAANGDPAAFRTIFSRHRVDVQRLVFRMVGARPDLDDIVQEVFIQVYRSLKDFRGQSKFSTWLHRVTVNVVLMHRRAARSRPTYAEEASDDLVADPKQVLPDEATASRDRMRAFGRLLDRLADKKRAVFVLHDLEGKSPAEIAEIVEAPVLTVRTRLFYARREIEAMWKDEPSLAALPGDFSRTSAEEDP